MIFISKTDPFLKNPVEVQKKLVESIAANPKKARLMHICGTHERTIAKYGIRSLLPPEIEVLSGPGCPVCVTPDDDIDTAILLAKKGLTMITFGDMLRVPGTEGSLFDARADGADVRMVYSIDDAIKMARENPNKEFVFFSIGFETTIPTTAAAVLRGLPPNFSIFTSLKLTPPAIDLLIQDINVDAFIAPGHVSVITGTQSFQSFEKLGYPVVVAGFESYDILLGIQLLQNQLKAGIAKVENAYPRAVKPEGNQIALKMMEDVFDKTDSEWRGLGMIPDSGLKLKDKYDDCNAALKYKELYAADLEKLREIRQKKKKNCICAAILTGKATPADCPMFGKTCQPLSPIGPCMVSDEGMCHSWYKYCRD
ncbi:MAG: hydrogenase formation protein HypD [Methanimicrococcus sp.]|nr:hydrogenase formation protein HypD [Methanimicrococcus sp.]